MFARRWIAMIALLLTTAWVLLPSRATAIQGETEQINVTDDVATSVDVQIIGCRDEVCEEPPFDSFEGIGVTVSDADSGEQYGACETSLEPLPGGCFLQGIERGLTLEISVDEATLPDGYIVDVNPIVETFAPGPTGHQLFRFELYPEADNEEPPSGEDPGNRGEPVHFMFFRCEDAGCVDDPDLTTGMMAGQVIELTSADGESYGECTIWEHTAPNGCWIYGPGVGDVVTASVKESKLPDTVELLENDIQIEVVGDDGTVFPNTIHFYAVQTVDDADLDRIQVRALECLDEACEGGGGIGGSLTGVVVSATDEAGVVVFGSCVTRGDTAPDGCAITGLPVDGTVTLWAEETSFSEEFELRENGITVDLSTHDDANPFPLSISFLLDNAGGEVEASTPDASSGDEVEVEVGAPIEPSDNDWGRCTIWRIRKGRPQLAAPSMFVRE